MPDDDTLIGQNEIDVRNEARNPLNAMPIRHVAFTPVAKCCDREWWTWGSYRAHLAECHAAH